MARLMSVALTTEAVRSRRKTVTRRVGWLMLTAGDQLTLCPKVRGRRRDTMILVGLMVGTLLLQSGMGASAVLWPQKSSVLKRDRKTTRPPTRAIAWRGPLPLMWYIGKGE